MFSSPNHHDRVSSVGAHGRLGAPGQPWLLYGLFLVAGIAQAAVVPLLPRLAGRYGLSPADTALLLALPGLATLTVSVPSGLAADRFGARRVTLAAGVLLCVSSLAQATPSLAALLVGRAVFGIAFGVVWTSGLAWLAECRGSDGAEAGSRLGPAVTCSSVGIMAGPAVGGALAEAAGLAAPFVVIAVASAVVVLALSLGRSGSGEKGEAAAPRPSLAPRALVGLARRPRVRAAAGALIVSGAVSSASQLLISGDLHGLGISTAQIGIVFSVSAACYILVSAVTVRAGARARTLRCNALASACLAVAVLPALAGGDAAAYAAALLLSAAPRAMISTIAYALAAEDPSHPPGGDGLVFGMLNGAWAAATVVTPLVAGVVEQSGGARAAYLAVILPACGVAALLVAAAPSGERARRGDGFARRTRAWLAMRAAGWR